MLSVHWGSVTSRPFMEEVVRRQRLALCLLALGLVGGSAGVFLGGSSGAAVGVGVLVGTSVASMGVLSSLSCPSCRHPFFWDATGSNRSWSWFFRESCAHCDRLAETSKPGLEGSSSVGSN